jgi:SAM-dependent methyltransferase
MIELHRKLLGDHPRNQAFYDALKKVIMPGESIVADIGSGTGFLSFLASALGAKECYLYEFSDVLELSRALAKANRITNCHFIPMHSTQAKRPPKADVVISETLGNYALEENIIETLNDAHRFLKPGGAIIPHGLTQFVAPVTSPRMYDEINVWDKVGFDLNLSLAKTVCMNNMYVRAVEPADLLPDSATCWDTIDFTKKNASKRSAKLSWKVSTPQTVYGFCLWWESQLLPGVSISTSPFKPRTHWDQIYLPVVEPIKLAKDEIVTLDIRSDSRISVKINLEWDVTAGKTTQKLDMRRGYLS